MPRQTRRRSVLYVPASNLKAMAKVASLDCDAVIFDLEDAVAPDARARARENLVTQFRDASHADAQEMIIRVNQTAGTIDRGDLAAVEACRPHAMLIPKVESDAMLLDARAALGADGRDIRLWAMIETPAGIVRLRDIVECGARDDVGLDCLVVGTNDLSKETGVPMPAGRKTMDIWLATIVIHARAVGLDVIDGVYNDFRDEAGFAAECEAAVLAGFDGKTLIHPTQVAPANAAFTPSPHAIAEARAIIAAFDDPANAGKGVISIDGKMAELLHAVIARRVLAKAR